MGKETDRNCFVIMPFSRTNRHRTKEYWTNHYENFLKPLIVSCDIQVARSEPFRQNILREIIHRLVFSKVVVADLTDRNPNVYWELGVRQSFRHGTVTIIDESSKKIPFDLQGKGTLPYCHSDPEKNEFSARFKAAVKDCLENSKRPDSEILESITGRTSVYQVIHQDEIRQKIEGLIFENTDNFGIFRGIMNTVDKNKNRKGILRKPGKMISLFHMNDSALCNLMTERYLEDKDKFYKIAAHMLRLISAINQNVSTWESSSESVETYFLEKAGFFETSFNQFQAMLIEIREEASKWL